MEKGCIERYEWECVGSRKERFWNQKPGVPNERAPHVLDLGHQQRAMRSFF